MYSIPMVNSEARWIFFEENGAMNFSLKHYVSTLPLQTHNLNVYVIKLLYTFKGHLFLSFFFFLLSS